MPATAPRKQLSERLLSLLVALLLGWLIALIQILKDCRERRRRRRERRQSPYDRVRCFRLPSRIYKRPDPFIYSQRYLMKQGLGVTWDNPDIQLFKGGAPVPSSALAPATEYEIRATYYNGSTEGIAINMPVHFSFLSFGIGTTSTAIATTAIDLPVKGAPGQPAIAAVKWTTPAAPGHYCIQVQADWADSADPDPDRRFGQENTNVGVFASPAVFKFPVQNDQTFPVDVVMEVDCYALPARISCDDVLNGRLVPIEGDKPLSREELCKRLQRLHDSERFPVPPDWKVEIEPASFSLAPAAQQLVKVTITKPSAFKGIKAFNANAFRTDGGQHVLVGGVTLYAQAN